MAIAKDLLSLTFESTYKPLWGSIVDLGKDTDRIDTSVEKYATLGPSAEHAKITKLPEFTKAALADGDSPYKVALSGKGGLSLHDEARAIGPGGQSLETETVGHALDTTVSHALSLASNLTSLFGLGTLLAAKVADTSPLLLQIGGSADAVGTDTLATADLFSRVVDYGSISIGYGRATFSTRAEVSGDDIAFASATSFANVSGADFVFTGTISRSSALESESGATATERSQTYALAIDFEAWDLRSGPVVVDLDSDKDVTGTVPYLQDLIDGNVATLDVDATAEGTNTYVDVAASVLTVEDALSSVSAVVTTGVA